MLHKLNIWTGSSFYRECLKLNINGNKVKCSQQQTLYKKLPPKGNTCTHQVGIPGAPTTTHATQANALRRLKLQSALESRLGIKDLQEHETELTYG